MIEKKNIDRLFQEKFKDFEVSPREEVWQSLQPRLPQKKKRRIIPFWIRISGVAALLVIALFAGRILHFEASTSLSDSEKPSVSPETHPDNTIPNVGSTLPEALVTNEESSETDTTARDLVNPSPEPGVPSSSSVNTPSSSHKSSPASHRRDGIARNDDSPASTETPELKGNKPELDSPAAPFNHAEQSVIVDAGQIDQNDDTTGGGNSSPSGQNRLTSYEDIIANDIADSGSPKDTTSSLIPPLEEELLKDQKTDIAEKTAGKNRWQIMPNAAPIFLSSTSSGSPLDPMLKENSKSFRQSYSYGIAVGYSVTDRLTIRSGVSNLKLAYSTDDVLISQVSHARMLQNVKPNARGQMLQIDNKPIAATTTLGRMVTQFSGSVSQTTGYIEIPVEIGYKILDRKFDIELTGGFSTLFLNLNEVAVLSSGMELSIGEATNLNEVHFSTNLGVGFKYNLWKSFEARVEPALKYQMNTFSNDSGNFRPFFFGIYTGINYRF